MSFGRNQTGRNVEDRVAAQAFSNVEKDFERLELRVKALESFVGGLPKQLEPAMNLIENPTASTFNAAGVTAVDASVVKLVDALKDLSNRVKKL